MYFKWHVEHKKVGLILITRYSTMHQDIHIYGTYAQATNGKLLNPKMFIIKDNRKIDLTDDSIRDNFIGGCFFAVEMEKRYFRHLSLDKKEGMV